MIFSMDMKKIASSYFLAMTVIASPDTSGRGNLFN
jgi:hypothetical protein